MGIKWMIRCAVFAALLCLCAWLCIPAGGTVFTMQTFGVFLTLRLLGGKYGTAAVTVYLLLGVVGLPVFSGFRGGAGVLLGAAGGYIWGFLAAALVYWLLERFRVSPWLGCAAGLIACYTVGTVWYTWAYAGGSGLWAVLLQCVVPYILPDTAKLLLSGMIAKRLKNTIQ